MGGGYSPDELEPGRGAHSVRSGEDLHERRGQGDDPDPGILRVLRCGRGLGPPGGGKPSGGKGWGMDDRYGNFCAAGQGGGDVPALQSP